MWISVLAKRMQIILDLDKMERLLSALVLLLSYYLVSCYLVYHINHFVTQQSYSSLSVKFEYYVAKWYLVENLQ